MCNSLGFSLLLGPHESAFGVCYSLHHRVANTTTLAAWLKNGMDLVPQACGSLALLQATEVSVG